MRMDPQKVRCLMPIKGKPVSGPPGAAQPAFMARLHRMAQSWPSSGSLAQAAGVSPSALRKWLKGQAEPSRERLVALAEAAGVSVSWLATGEGPEPAILTQAAPERGARAVVSRHAPGRLDPARFCLLPKQPESAAAGRGNPPTPEAVEFIGFRQDWIAAALGRAPENLALETALGESMAPNIGNGDLLLVDVSDRTCGNFGIYVLEVRGERLVKRVQLQFDGSMILISDNQIYQPELIAADLTAEITVIGRVVWRGGKL